MKLAIQIACGAAISLASCTTQQKTIEPKGVEFDFTAVTYTSHVKSIIDNNCIGCHSGNEPADSLDLSSYENVKHAVNDHQLLDLIHSDSKPMPPEGLMPIMERKIIKSWAENGFKQA